MREIIAGLWPYLKHLAYCERWPMVNDDCHCGLTLARRQAKAVVDHIPSPSQIVGALMVDLTDRRGLRQAWESIDASVQAEILEAWETIVRSALSGQD